MNFIQDNTLQDDPSIIISDITTQGNYALSVDGSLNAESLNINGVDVYNIFLKISDINSNLTSNLLSTKGIKA